MTRLPDDLRERLLSLDLVGFAVQTEVEEQPVAGATVAKQGLRKGGICKAGIVKRGMSKPGFSRRDVPARVAAA